MPENSSQERWRHGERSDEWKRNMIESTFANILSVNYGRDLLERALALSSSESECGNSTFESEESSSPEQSINQGNFPKSWTESPVCRFLFSEQPPGSSTPLKSSNPSSRMNSEKQLALASVSPITMSENRRKSVRNLITAFEKPISDRYSEYKRQMLEIEAKKAEISKNVVINWNNARKQRCCMPSELSFHENAISSEVEYASRNLLNFSDSQQEQKEEELPTENFLQLNTMRQSEGEEDSLEGEYDYSDEQSEDVKEQSQEVDECMEEDTTLYDARIDDSLQKKALAALSEPIRTFKQSISSYDSVAYSDKLGDVSDVMDMNPEWYRGKHGEKIVQKIDNTSSKVVIQQSKNVGEKKTPRLHINTKKLFATTRNPPQDLQEDSLSIEIRTRILKNITYSPPIKASENGNSTDDALLSEIRARMLRNQNMPLEDSETSSNNKPIKSLPEAAPRRYKTFEVAPPLENQEDRVSPNDVSLSEIRARLLRNSENVEQIPSYEDLRLQVERYHSALEEYQASLQLYESLGIAQFFEGYQEFQEEDSIVPTYHHPTEIPYDQLEYEHYPTYEQFTEAPAQSRRTFEVAPPLSEEDEQLQYEVYRSQTSADNISNIDEYYGDDFWPEVDFEDFPEEIPSVKDLKSSALHYFESMYEKARHNIIEKTKTNEYVMDTIIRRISAVLFPFEMKYYGPNASHKRNQSKALSLVIQSQNASKNACLPLNEIVDLVKNHHEMAHAAASKLVESMKYADEYPETVKSALIDVVLQVDQYTSHNLILQCQNAAKSAFEREEEVSEHMSDVLMPAYHLQEGPTGYQRMVPVEYWPEAEVPNTFETTYHNVPYGLNKDNGDTSSHLSQTGDFSYAKITTENGYEEKDYHTSYSAYHSELPFILYPENDHEMQYNQNETMINDPMDESSFPIGYEQVTDTCTILDMTTGQYLTAPFRNVLGEVQHLNNIQNHLDTNGTKGDTPGQNTMKCSLLKEVKTFVAIPNSSSFPPPSKNN